MTTADEPVLVEGVSHAYGEREALRDVSFAVREGEVFALLGPNGGGKTTLFRILCTAMRATRGAARIGGYDVASAAHQVRRIIGVVFQSPGLDGKLTVSENLRHQGHLYGLTGMDLRSRIDEMLGRFGLADRARDRVDTLSGGLARRVDLARGLLHRPKVLLLDEPSTGLDPQARRELWRYLDLCRREEHLTAVMTTHFMDEADRCDRVGIIDVGRLVAVDAPDVLKGAIAGDCLSLEADRPADLAAEIAERFSVPVQVVNGQVRIERDRAHEFIPVLVEAFPERIRSVSLSKPSLEDVFIHHTGHPFEERERADG